MFVLDTDHLSLIQRGGAEGLRVLSRLRNCPPDDVAVSVISFEEQTRGWLTQINQHADTLSQVRAYSELRRLLQSYCYITILDFDKEAAQ